MKSYVNPNDSVKQFPFTSIVGGLVLGACVFLILPLTQGGTPDAIPVPPVDTHKPFADDPPEPPDPPKPAEDDPPPPLKPPQLPQVFIDHIGNFEPTSGGIPVWTPDVNALGPGPMKNDWTTLGDLDNNPRAVVRVSPVYPYRMKTAGIEGYAHLDLMIDEGGRVVDAKLRRSSHQAFAEAAVKAIYKWKFEPGTIDGKAVKVKRVQKIAFTLR